ncbi:ypgQ [Scenedesmus sp. PABB004]|nr:ypgQ [Scenedesmus sp. PABB004]
MATQQQQPDGAAAAALLVAAAEAHVRAALAGHDDSHGWSHIARVRAMALRLAREEQLEGGALLAVELAALLHDLSDYKYGGSDEQAAAGIEEFLGAQHGQPELAQRVVAIVRRVGFKDELPGGGAAPGGGAPPPLSAEAAVVQDADRLDAIGAVGIARCFTFGGARGALLHDPALPPRVGLTKAQYMAGGQQATTINHFYEKLLTIKGLMKTAAGRRVAEARHAVMVAFLDQFHAEWEGRA